MSDALALVVAVAGGAGAVAGAVIAWWKVGRAVIRTVRKLGRLADEVLGDGDQRPGWGPRLVALERQMAEVVEQLRPNGGGSIRDKIDRIDRRVKG